MPPSDVRSVVQQFLDDKWAVVPVPAKSKKSTESDWSNKTYQRSDFKDSDNIATMCGPASDGRICIDGDCPEAVHAAAVFLPDTLVEGRPSNPMSHYWYRSAAKTETFTDIDNKTMLVEIKASGYVMRPPSWHDEDPEQYEVQVDSPILDLEAADARQKTAYVATTALIARHWGASRHHASGPIAGLLLQLGVDPRYVKLILKTAFEIANDEELADRMKFVDTTIEKFAEGENIAGGPKLETMIDPRVIAKIRQWLGKQTRRRPQPVLRKLSEVEPEETTFLWFPYIPQGKVTIIEGDPGDGKSHVTLAISTAVSLGRGLPEMGAPVDPQNVLLMNAEDGLGDTVRPRLDRMQGDVDRIYAIDGALTFDEIGLTFIEKQITDTKAGLLVIDPWVAYVGGKLNMDKANETREVLYALSEIAKKHNVAILLVRHLTKGNRDKSIYRGLGSIDITAAVRSVLLIGKDANDPTRRAIVHIKHNITAPGPSIAYTIEQGLFRWIGKCDMTATDILAAEGTEDKSKIEEATDTLRAMLANGPRSEKEIKQRMSDLDISSATFRRAKSQLKIKSQPVKDKNGKIKGWTLSLPSASPLLANAEVENPF
jgi:hypothetical protein